MVSLVPFRYHVTLLMNHFVLPQSRYVVIGNLLSNNGWAPSTVSSPGCLSTVTVCRPLPGINLYAGHGCCGDPRPSQQFLSFSNFGGDFILEWQKKDARHFDGRNRKEKKNTDIHCLNSVITQSTLLVKSVKIKQEELLWYFWWFPNQISKYMFTYIYLCCLKKIKKVTSSSNFFLLNHTHVMKR